MVTLQDIADEAGVSKMTVSNVVNGNLSKVSKENAERIQAIIRKRKYVPNSSARSLAKCNSNIIAIILRGGKDENSLKNPHNAELVGSIIEKVQSHGYYSMVNMVQSQKDISQSLRTWNVEGAFFLGMFDDEIEHIYKVNDIPMVFVDSYSDVRQLSNVGIDDYKGGQLAARHLLDNGHSQFLFVSPPNKPNGVIQKRLDGFLAEVKKAGCRQSAVRQVVLDSDLQPEAIMQAAVGAGKSIGEATAAFITSDQIAAFFIQGLRTVGLRVPEDVSLIGFDNMLISAQVTPQLTTIAQNLEQKADLAVDILFRKLAETGPAESRVLNVTLVERDSVRSI